MASRKPHARAGLTFSEAHGLEPLPQPLALGEVSDRFRLRIWNWLYQKMDSNRDILSGPGLVEPWREVMRSVHSSCVHLPLDEFDGQVATLVQVFKPRIVGKGAMPFNYLFDILQFVLRHRTLRQSASKNLASSCVSEIRAIFQESLLAYDVVDVAPDGPTVVPNATPEEGKAVRQAFAILATSSFDGARTHLRKAAESINAGQAPDAIREAVHAVESTVRVIAPNKSFKDALAAVDAKAALHPALRDALTKLYGYSSDEKGIRHPLLESDVARVGMPEAVFMFGACASFISYLISRARGSGMLKA